MIKACFSFLILCVSIGALVSIVIFAVDVIKWHSREERFKVVPSALESEVNTIERGDTGRDRGANRDGTSDRGAIGDGSSERGSYNYHANGDGTGNFF